MDIVEPTYASIEPVRQICEEWIDLWGCNEWGDSMRSLCYAAKTCYGFSNEDCALFANKLLENLIAQKQWMDEEGHQYFDDSWEPTQTKCRELRDYWFKGGNMGDWGGTPVIARRTIEKLPSWVFGEND